MGKLKKLWWNIWKKRSFRSNIHDYWYWKRIHYGRVVDELMRHNAEVREELQIIVEDKIKIVTKKQYRNTLKENCLLQALGIRQNRIVLENMIICTENVNTQTIYKETWG